MTASDIPAVHRILSADFKRNPAPIVDFIATQGRDPLKILLATILSARTQDKTTAKVVNEKLFPAVKSLENLRALTVTQIESLIYPVGFYHQKALALKKLPEAIDEKFGGKIPDTVESLCELPGVGRKTANLVVAVAFDKPAICVDVHVHRINKRLGFVRTKTPLETEMRLREILPVRYWKTWNACFVSYGQRRCTPLRPKCGECLIAKYCVYNRAKR